MPPATPADDSPVPRLALRLRTLRQLHGSASLEQAQLAALAGIPVRHLRALESTRGMPPSLRPWRALADALHCSLDELLMGDDAAASRPVVGVVLRSDLAAAVCCAADAILEVRTRGRRRRRTGSELDFAVQLANDYGATTIVTDTARTAFRSDRTPEKFQRTRELNTAAVLAANVSVVVSRFQDAAALVGLAPAKPRALAAWALATDPRLARFVKLSRKSGWVAAGDRAGPRILLAAAFAFAHAQDRRPVGQLPLPFDM